MSRWGSIAVVAFALSFSVSTNAFLFATKYRIFSHEEFNYVSENDGASGWLGLNGKYGETRVVADPQCNPLAVEDLILKSDNMKAGVSELSSLLNRCHGVLHQGLENSYLEMLNEIQTEYVFEDAGNVTGLKFRDAYGRTIKALLALKPTINPIPLVIFKCGVNCNLGSKTARKAMMQFFDEGPFHVLVVPNMTGSDFVYANKQMGFGGFDEGRNLIEIARYVSSSQFPHASRFSSVHIMGISLGGLATFYSAAYHDAEVAKGGTPFVRSFTSACPVVDMESGVREVFRNPIARFVFGNTILNHARYIVDEQSPIKTMEDVLKSPLSRPDLVGFFGQAYSEIWQLLMRHVPWNSAPLDTITIRNAFDFWAYNRFYYYTEHIKSPYLVWNPDDDPVVLPSENTDVLMKTAQERNVTSMNFLKTEHGNHCSFAVNYGWGVSGIILRSFMIKNSPELLATRAERLLPADFIPKKIRTLSKNLSRRDLSFRALLNSDKIQIVSRLRKSACNQGGKNRESCWANSKFTMNLQALGINKPIPKNETQVDGLTRWLNANIHFLNASGSHVGRRDNIANLRITSFGQELN